MKKIVFLQDIDFKTSPRVRAGLVQEVVNDYAERYSKREKLPPPSLAQIDENGKEYICLDGMHRITALKANGAKATECEVTKMTWEDAVKESLTYNRTHGLRRSQDDKRRCVATALATWPEKSNLAISQLAGVDDKTVNAVRKELEKEGKIQKAEKKDTKGRSVPERDKEAPAAKAKVSDATDSTGFVLPKEIRGVWEEAQRSVGLGLIINRAMAEIEAAEKANPIVFIEVNLADVLGALEKAVNGINLAVPYAVCTVCQGHPETQDKGCKFCKGRGFTSRFLYDTTPPDVKRLRTLAIKKGAAE